MSGEQIFPLYLVAIALQPLVGISALLTAKLSPRLARALPVASSALPLALLAFLPPGIRVGGFIFDELSQVFSLVISTVGFLCMVYSYGYMAHDEALGRYYFWMLTFIASMLLLVIADSILLFMLAWELTSLCSFSLIAHWNFRRESTVGALKALLVTEVGSSLMLLGFALSGSTSLSGAVRADVAAQALLVAGALAKSAQYPALLWLPDAMEAPTPVSAYLHAAAMVKAGVYLLARLSSALDPRIALCVAILGCASMLAGSFLMLFPEDIKRVLAYSTISHLGLLTTAVSIGGLLPALVHLINHAAAKALLFLTAGAVEHETGRRSLTELGGLARQMPLTAACFSAGFLSLVGVPVFGGFVSKWLVLADAISRGGSGWVLVAALLISTALAFMGFARVLGGVFFGAPAREGEAAEPGLSMLVPMLLLAAVVVFLGVFPDPLLSWAAAASPPLKVPLRDAVGQTATALLLCAVALGVLAYAASRRPRLTTVYLCGEDPTAGSAVGASIYADLYGALRGYAVVANPDAWLIPLAKRAYSAMERAFTSRRFCVVAVIALVALTLIFSVRWE